MSKNLISYTDSNYKEFGELKEGDPLYIGKLDKNYNYIEITIPIEKLFTIEELLIHSYGKNIDNLDSFNVQLYDNKTIIYLESYYKNYKNNYNNWRGDLLIDKNASCVRSFDFTDSYNKELIFVFTTKEERKIEMLNIMSKYIDKLLTYIETSKKMIHNLNINCENLKGRD